jgi:hypothetical protein
MVCVQTFTASSSESDVLTALTTAHTLLGTIASQPSGPYAGLSQGALLAALLRTLPCPPHAEGVAARAGLLPTLPSPLPSGINGSGSSSIAAAADPPISAPANVSAAAPAAAAAATSSSGAVAMPSGFQPQQVQQVQPHEFMDVGNEGVLLYRGTTTDNTSHNTSKNIAPASAVAASVSGGPAIPVTASSPLPIAAWAEPRWHELPFTAEEDGVLLTELLGIHTVALPEAVAAAAQYDEDEEDKDDDGSDDEKHANNNAHSSAAAPSSAAARASATASSAPSAGPSAASARAATAPSAYVSAVACASSAAASGKAVDNPAADPDEVDDAASDGGSTASGSGGKHAGHDRRRTRVANGVYLNANADGSSYISVRPMRMD